MRFSLNVRDGLAAGIAMLASHGFVAIDAQSLVVRPRVELEIRIPADAYRRNAKAEVLSALEAALTDSAKAVARELYPFLDWTGGAGSSDTVDIRIIDRYSASESIPWSRLELSIRADKEHRLRDSVAYHTEYEDFTRVFSRRVGPSAWTFAALLPPMASQLRASLATPSLLASVFGRIPIKAPIDITKDGEGLVQAHPRELGASETQSPTFTVMARVLAATSDAIGEFALTSCISGRGTVAYSCTVSKLEYVAGRKTFIPPELTNRLRVDTVQPRGLLVTTFQPDPLASRSGAINPP